MAAAWETSEQIQSVCVDKQTWFTPTWCEEDLAEHLASVNKVTAI